MSEYAVALDVGGTFTDVTLVELEGGQIWSVKTPTTPSDPSLGFQQGVQEVLARANVSGSALTRVFHATTTATNAILERKGVTTGLITTDGFKFVLEIGRHDGPRRLNKYYWTKPERPVPPRRVMEVSERVSPEGEEEIPLDEAAVRAAARTLGRQGVESLAIALLYSYANPAHERRARELVLEELPHVSVSLSSDVLPVFREYERSMATVLNAYVMPLVGRYLGQLRQRMVDAGISAHLYVMKSNGGLVSPEVVAIQPVTTALSGPAAAVIGAVDIATASGFPDLISIDVGGTSADVCLVEGGQPETTEEGSVGTWPLSVPMINVHTIGAGGGSLARVGAEGILSVGPESAGALPGPVCYAQGGTQPTVTDAHLVLGHLPDYLVSGGMRLDRAAAEAALRAKIAEPLGMSVEEAASGVLELVNNNMMGAIRVVSVERGRDPRSYALVPGGGAGPLHATDLADLLDMPAVLVPQRPGVLSTFGLLFSALGNDFVRTRVMRLAEVDPDEMGRTYDTLAANARAWLERENVAEEHRRFERFATLRYVNQMFELSIPWPDGPVDAAVLARVAETFHQKHLEMYTYNSPSAPVEVVTLRLHATGALKKMRVPPLPESGGATPTPARRRLVYFNREAGFVDTAIYDRESLTAGMVIHGPAVVEQMDSNTLIPARYTCRVDALGTLILTRGRTPIPSAFTSLSASLP